MSATAGSWGGDGWLPLRFRPQAGAFIVSRTQPAQLESVEFRIPIGASDTTGPRRECPVLSGGCVLNYTRFSARVNRIPTELETNS
jgi:hypothetical protein